MFPDLSTYRVLGFIAAKNVFGYVYRDDVAERLANGEFYSNPIQTGARGGALSLSPRRKKLNNFNQFKVIPLFALRTLYCA